MARLKVRRRRRIEPNAVVRDRLLLAAITFQLRRIAAIGAAARGDAGNDLLRQSRG
jgi:hypothetical protein